MGWHASQGSSSCSTFVPNAQSCQGAQHSEKINSFFRAQHIPDSHLTGQLSGLRIWPGEGSNEEEVLFFLCSRVSCLIISSR